jgi:alpha-ketoglutarate-dependent taurine dioxygenase
MTICGLQFDSCIAYLHSRRTTPKEKESKKKRVINKLRTLKGKCGEQTKEKKAMIHISRLKWNGLGDELQKLVTQIRQALTARTGGICVVTAVPLDDNNAAFLSIANALGGELLRDTRMPSHAMEADCAIYRVEEDPLNTDEYAHSATNQHFPFHTDCAHFLHPPQVMMLLCCQPSRTGGKTTLAHVDDILEKLNDEDKADLSRIQFPWWQGSRNVHAPILTKVKEDGQWLIRFNQATLRKEMDKDKFTNISALKSLINVLDSFETDPKNILSLSAGDLLIVHNQRVLHGRTKFSTGSPRLLKRLRMRIPDL